MFVIPKGNVAIGSITDAEHKKRMARGGKLDIMIEYVKLADGESGAPGGHTRSEQRASGNPILSTKVLGNLKQPLIFSRWLHPGLLRFHGPPDEC